MTSFKEQTAVIPEDRLAIGSNPHEVRVKVPFAMTEKYFVPRERYYDRGFFELEKKHLWPHSWLMAARLEEIPSPGDYTEFEIAGNSVLIIRQRDGSVKALHNSCRHRATELAKGCGRFRGGQVVCPFHGWRWNLDGSSSYVLFDDLYDPSTLKPDDLRLRECLVELWAGMVWINMDLTARPLSEALWPVQEMLDDVGVGNMRAKWWKQVVLNGNWKIAMEAFLETIHTMQTHPQLMMGGGEQAAFSLENNIEFTSFRNGHGRFRSLGRKQTTDWDFDDYIENSRLIADGQDAMVLDRDLQVMEGLRNKIDPKDPDFAIKVVQALYDYAEGAGIPMAPPSQELGSGGEIFMFPNYFMLPSYSNCLCYRMRPYNDDPQQTLFDVWSLTTYPAGHEPGRLELTGRFDKEDTANWGLIPRQDFSNIEKQQRGMHSQSFEKMRLSPTSEKNIVNLHEELDRVIACRL